MHLFRLLSITFSFFLLFSTNAQSQDKTHYTDMIYLNDGSVFRGIITEYKQGDHLKLKLKSGDELFIVDKVIKKIVQGAEGSGNSRKEQRWASRQQKTYEFKEKGIYNVTYVSTLNGYTDRNGVELGLGVDNVTGYQFNRHIGAGVGVSWDTYNVDSGENFLTLFGETRGYVLKKRLSPYYSLGAGYGFAIRNEENNLTEATGGWMIHPAIGYRFGGSKDANFIMDIGYKFQRAKLTYEWDWGRWSGSPEIERQELTFQRFTLRVGLIF